MAFTVIANPSTGFNIDVTQEPLLYTGYDVYTYDQYEYDVDPTAITTVDTLITVEPTTLTTAIFAPSITASDNAFVTTLTPSSLVTTTYEPTVSFTNNFAITSASPTSITTSTWNPTVSFTANVAVTPGLASLSATSLAPNISFTNNISITPNAASLTVAQQNPSVSISDNVAVSPSNATVTTTTYTPTIAISDNIQATPETTTIGLTAQLPIAVVNQIITPEVLSLNLASFEPTVEVDLASVEVTPLVAEMITTIFSPTVVASDNKFVTPSTAQLRLKGTRPIINGIVPANNYYIDSSGEVYWVISQELGLVEKI